MNTRLKGAITLTNCRNVISFLNNNASQNVINMGVEKQNTSNKIEKAKYNTILLSVGAFFIKRQIMGNNTKKSKINNEVNCLSTVLFFVFSS
ncbi:MAG: hypothetical protein IJ297_06375 [Clostridia bacterium]|nr:hypothetical protein [Clostridia bacterium]